MNQQIIRRNAGLTCIECLTPRNTSRGQLQIRALIHDAGALATKLQHYGREILGRSAHNGSSQRGAAREEDYIVALLQKQAVHIAVTLHDSDISLLERIGHHLLDNVRDRWYIGRGLQHRRTSCRDSANKRIQKQLHRIVPRRDDERDAERLAYDARTRRHHLKRCRAALGAHPTLQVAKMCLHLALDNAQLGQHSLLLRLVQILPQGLAEWLVPLI